MHTSAVIMMIGVHGARNAASLLATPVPDGSGGTMSASQIETSAGSALARGRRQPAPAALGVG
jgi:hypothetical protein